MHSSDELPLHCPQCGKRVTIKWGASTLNVMQAIRLQLVRNGVFFQCTSCLNEWVIRNVSHSHLEGATVVQKDAAAISSPNQPGIPSGNESC